MCVCVCVRWYKRTGKDPYRMARTHTHTDTLLRLLPLLEDFEKGREIERKVKWWCQRYVLVKSGQEEEEEGPGSMKTPSLSPALRLLVGEGGGRE